MSVEIGSHPGYYVGLERVIARFATNVFNACAGAAGVVNSYFLYKKAQLFIKDPEEYKKRYPAEFKDDD